MKEIPLPRYVKRRETHSLENPHIRIRNLEANQTAKGLSVISGSELLLLCRGPEFGSQYSCGGLQPSVTPVLGDPVPSGLREHQEHKVHLCTYRQNTNTHESKQTFNFFLIL